jgi:hypothetical protein
MPCSGITNDVLLDVARGAAGAEARAHVEGCAACRQELEALRALAADLERLGRATSPAADPAAIPRVLARLAPAKKPRPARHYSTRRSPWPWVGAAAAAAVAVTLVLATRRPERPRPEVGLREPERPTEHDAPPGPAEKPPGPPDAPPRVVAPAPPTPPLPAPPGPVAPPPKAAEPVPEKPGAPEAPAPPPPPPAKAAAPAGETRPATAALAVAKLEGAFEVQEEKAWKRLEKPGAWEAGTAVRAADRPGRLTLADGTRLTLRARTELRAAAAPPAAVQLDSGEVFCEVAPGKGRRFAVVTPDARVEVTGTQFAVRRTDHTEVVVASGEVTVSNDKGETAVPAGSGASVRKSAAPSRPRPVDADGTTAWRRAAEPPETPRFRYDFEDGRTPYPWTNGKVAPGPGRGFNRHCLEGSPGVDADLSRVDRRVPVVKLPMKVRFRYYAASGDELAFQLSTERVRDNFRFDVRPLVHGKWEGVEAPLSEFYRLADRTSKLEDGDRFGWLNITVWGATGPVYFDDIELVEVLK